MSRHYARRRDANHGTITADLERAGYSVLPIDRAGTEDAPDVLVGYAGIDQLVEIKNPDSRYGKAGASEGQTEFLESWRGRKPIVAYCAEDVFAAYRRLLRSNALIEDQPDYDCGATKYADR